MRRLKVGLVLDDTLDSVDGVQQYVLLLGRWLAEQGHEVHYLVGETKRTDIEHVHSLSRNFKVRFNGNRMSLPLPVSRRKLRDLFATVKFDVLYVQMPYSPFLGQPVIKQAPMDTVIVGMFHVLPYGGLVILASRLLAWWLRSSLKRFDAIFANTVATQTFVKQVYGCESTISPMVIEVSAFMNVKPMPQYDDAKLTVMYLGRLVPRKGADTLLKAVATLVQYADVPSFRVLICGRGPLDAELKNYVARQGLQDRVTFTGFLSEADKPRYMASADIIVYPSSGGESFGIVLLEAMASGAVVLAGDNPGYRSVLSPKPELLFTPRQPALLADKLATYLKDMAARQAIITWEKDYVRQFDVAVVGRTLLAAYIRLLH